MCMCPFMHMHKCVPVYADQCVGIFGLPVSVSHHNKPNQAQRASFLIYGGHGSLDPQHRSRICMIVLPYSKSFYVGSL